MHEYITNNKLKHWNNVKPDDKILSELIYSNSMNLLFVGRINLNNGHKMMFEIIKDYIEHYDDKIKLYLLIKNNYNGRDGLIKYNNELNYLINKYRLQENVEFIGEVNDNELISYYLGCDFFLCVSGNEGFFMPIVEAQYLRLPVLAKKTSAIVETIGNNQLLFDDDIRYYSSAIKIISENENYKDYLVENGYTNCVSRFDDDIIAENI